MIYSKIMEPINLQILNITGDEFAVDAEDGEKVFQMIFTALKEDKKVNLSFRNITILTTAFLNTAWDDCMVVLQKNSSKKIYRFQRLQNPAKLL